LGRNNDLNGVGVYGVAPAGIGVHGESTTGTAVGGRSSSGVAVYGKSTSNSAIYGESSSSYPVGAVNGVSLGGGPGVSATATNTVALYSRSTNNIAIYGNGDGGSGTAIYGHGTNGGSAGYFSGNVTVAGNFTVTGGAKSAAVPLPDGTVRRMYCVESPESWFEDFGRGQLVGGRAQVALDRDFAAIVKTDDYHIFPIPEGDCRGLFIANKSTSGFEVRELQGGASTISFSYRIIARRGDLAAPRLERVQLPMPALPVEVPGNPSTPVPVPTVRTT
jgi:hypothetical protein